MKMYLRKLISICLSIYLSIYVSIYLYSCLSTGVLDMTLNNLTLELWGMWSTPSLLSLPGLHWPRLVAPHIGPIYGLIRTKPWFFDLTVFCI